MNFLPDANVAWGLNIFLGAALGASFSILLKTQPYLVNRTFDPKYNTVYISRFITGIVAGVILAVGVSQQLGTGGKFPPGTLAILGGFAAEAVEQVLQRLVEVILAAVRGDGSAQVQAEAAKATAEQKAELQEQLAKLELAQTDPAKFQAALLAMRDALKKR